MESKTNHIGLLEESWKELQKWARDGRFDPNACMFSETEKRGSCGGYYH